MSSTIDEIIQETHDTLMSVWDFSTSPDKLAELPVLVMSKLNDLFDKVTNNGTLPSIDRQSITSIWIGEPAKPPPPPPKGALAKVADRVRQHWLLLAAVAVGGTIGTVYVYNSALIQSALVKPLKKHSRKFLPLALLPPSDRPKRSSDTRKEAVILLGADGQVGADIATDLESRGFVVIASVSHHSHVEQLEKQGRGFIKALVLDPFQPTSVGPFLRSLGSALSLRFPLHSPGDPFSSPAQMLTPSAIVNCLPLYGLEAKSPDEIEITDTMRLNSLVSTTVAAVRGTLPHLRGAAAKPSAETGVVVSLLPAETASVATPLTTLSSMASSSIESFLHSLRRESLLRRNNLHFTIIETGALAARKGGDQSRALRKLHRRVFHSIVDTRGGVKSFVGSGALSFSLLSYMPHVVIDRLIQIQHRLSASILKRTAEATSSRRPLPTPPADQPPRYVPRTSAGAEKASSSRPKAESVSAESAFTSDEEGGVSSSSAHGDAYSRMAESTGSFIHVDDPATHN